MYITVYIHIRSNRLVRKPAGIPTCLVRLPVGTILDFLQNPIAFGALRILGQPRLTLDEPWMTAIIGTMIQATVASVPACLIPSVLV